MKMKTKMKLEMEFVKTKCVKNYLGSTGHNYEVKNVIDTETGELITEKYIFGESKQFAVLGANVGDKISLTAFVEELEDKTVKISYFEGVRIVD